MIENLKEVVELATSLSALTSEILKSNSNKKKTADDNVIIVKKRHSAQIGSSGDCAKIGSSGNYAKIGSSGDCAQIGSSGECAQIGSSGNYAQIGSSGDCAQIGSSGKCAQIGSSGNYAKIGSSGNSAQIGSSGDCAKIGSSGNYAKIGSSGDCAQIGSSGECAQIGSSGNYAQIGSSGNSAKIGSSGDCAQIGSSGNYAKIGSSGDCAQIGSSGNYAKIDVTGSDTIACGVGKNTILKGKIGTWITLAEYDKNNKPICVKLAQIDGENLKEDTYYILQNKQFQECVFIDEIISIVIQKHKNVLKVKNLGSEKISYIVKDGNIYSHGDSIKEARESLLYKISNRDTSKYDKYTLDTKLTKKEAIEMYRVITGACEAGTRYFVENNKIPKNLTVAKVIEITKGQYGNETLVNFFEGKENE